MVLIFSQHSKCLQHTSVPNVSVFFISALHEEATRRSVHGCTARNVSLASVCNTDMQLSASSEPQSPVHTDASLSPRLQHRLHRSEQHSDVTVRLLFPLNQEKLFRCLRMNLIFISSRRGKVFKTIFQLWLFKSFSFSLWFLADRNSFLFSVSACLIQMILMNQMWCQSLSGVDLKDMWGRWCQLKQNSHQPRLLLWMNMSQSFM